MKKLCLYAAVLALAASYVGTAFAANAKPIVSSNGEQSFERLLKESRSQKANGGATSASKPTAKALALPSENSDSQARAKLAAKLDDQTDAPQVSLKVWFELLDSGDKVNPCDYKFKQGDEFRICVESAVDGYIAIHQKDENGELHQVYPLDAVPKSKEMIEAGKTTPLATPFHLDYNDLNENIKFSFTRKDSDFAPQTPASSSDAKVAQNRQAGTIKAILLRNDLERNLTPEEVRKATNCSAKDAPAIAKQVNKDAAKSKLVPMLAPTSQNAKSYYQLFQAQGKQGEFEFVIEKK